MLVTSNIRYVLTSANIDGCGFTNRLRLIMVDEDIIGRLVMVQHLDTCTLSIRVGKELYSCDSCDG